MRPAVQRGAFELWAFPSLRLLDWELNLEKNTPCAGRVSIDVSVIPSIFESDKGRLDFQRFQQITANP
jgi:hypothetical protein